VERGLRALADLGWHAVTDAREFADAYRGRRVLVTGHTGFKGAWLSLWLLRLGAEVHGISLGRISDPALFAVLGLQTQMDHRIGDVRDAALVHEVAADVRPHVVFHLAGQSIVRNGYADPTESFATNVLGTAHVLDAVRRVGEACCAVLVTSDKTYRNRGWEWAYRENDELGGRDPYSASKACAELVVRSYHASYFSTPGSPVRIASARAGNVVGGGDWAPGRIVPDCMRAWSQGRPVEVRNPGATRPWQHVLEPLSGYLALGAALLVDDAVAGEPFNFGPLSDAGTQVIDVIEMLSSFWSFEGQSERVHVAPSDGPYEAERLKLACDKAMTRLGWWSVLPLAEMARLTAEWYQAFYRGPGESVRHLTEQQIADYVLLARSQDVAWAQSRP
jgi:CDP-glucose 4,6-dehydratase